MRIIINSPADTGRAAKEFLRAFPGARLLAFRGEMGAGKTTFIKALCKELGITDLVQSPSFSIINHYIGKKGLSVFHFDFFRLKNTGELFDTGFEEYLHSGDYCMFEWPELAEPFLPEETLFFSIRITKDNQRIIEQIFAGQ
ncbi:MAG: tRNA (adenosine(37)-N6)-threonylcarbamoyltransferase complex ATPase subunit type 1 TsaE [Bacteroidota bacterium]